MKERSISTPPSELEALRELSARIGGNPLLAQASSGNTSIKLDDVLWIKASGKWLIQAEDDDFLVSVKLARANRCLEENIAIPETGTRSPGRLRPSIETAMHAILPHKVVIHVHSVNTIAWAVREDAPRQLSARLSGLPWQWIPYTLSGTFLASRIEHALSCFSQTSIFVLGNHGLVVCGSSCRSAEELLSEVERRLAIEPRPAPEPDYALLKQAASGSAWSIPVCAGVHALATDDISRRIHSGGVLYPCQAIFLCGIGSGRGHGDQMLLTVSNHGVLASEHMTRAERETLIGLANVVQRIDASAPLRYLTTSEVRDVVNGESEAYRRSADISCHPKGCDAARVKQLISARE